MSKETKSILATIINLSNIEDALAAETDSCIKDVQAIIRAKDETYQAVKSVMSVLEER